MREALELVLDEIRPAVQADGGDIEMLGVDNGVVRVRFHGACVACAGRAMTVAMMVEPVLKERVPGVVQVVVVEG